jgi:hypothetical protein
MFSYLLELLSPDNVETRLIAIVELSSFEQKAGESVDAYFARGRELHERLLRFKVEEIMPLLMLVRLNHDNFPGLQERIANADTTLMSADMNQVEQLVRKYEQMQKALGISPESTSATAHRAHAQKPDDKKPSPNNKPPEKPPAFPPDNFNWNAMIEYYKTHKNACPGCYQHNNQLHRNIGCLALARCVFVCKFHPVGSKKVQEEHVKAPKAKGGEKASAKRTSEDKAEEDDEKVKDDTSQASAKRSTAITALRVRTLGIMTPSWRWIAMKIVRQWTTDLKIMTTLPLTYAILIIVQLSLRLWLRLGMYQLLLLKQHTWHSKLLDPRFPQ